MPGSSVAKRSRSTYGPRLDVRARGGGPARRTPGRAGSGHPPPSAPRRPGLGPGSHATARRRGRARRRWPRSHRWGRQRCPPGPCDRAGRRPGARVGRPGSPCPARRTPRGRRTRRGSRPAGSGKGYASSPYPPGGAGQARPVALTGEDAALPVCRRPASVAPAPLSRCSRGAAMTRACRGAPRGVRWSHRSATASPQVARMCMRNLRVVHLRFPSVPPFSDNSLAHHASWETTRRT